MRKTKTAGCATIMFMAIIAIACAPKKDRHDGNHEEDATVVDDEWTGMDEFHMVMAESFHPYKDSANLQPAKQNASAMASAASKWLTSPLPHNVDNDAVKASLQQLSREANAFVETVKDKDDIAVGQALTNLHDVFHALQEAWYSTLPDEDEDH